MRENVYDKRWGQSGKDWWKASPYITTGGSALDGGVSLGRITEDQAYTWLHNYSVSQKNPPPLRDLTFFVLSQTVQNF